MDLVYEYDVYNMYFHDRKGFAIENVDFIPLESFWQEYADVEMNPLSPEKAGKSLLWRAYDTRTGVARVSWNAADASPAEAPHRTNELLLDHRLLLSFAHGHHVFFEPRSRSPNDDRNRTCTYRPQSLSKLGAPPILPKTTDPNRVEALLRHCAPLFRDSGFLDRTQAKRGMVWYTMTECYWNLPYEIRIPSLWTTLEILAGAHAIEKESNVLQSSDKLDEIKREVHALLVSRGICQPDKWVRKLTKHSLILDVVGEILDDFELPQEEKVLRPLYNLRNDIVHGEPVKYSRKVGEALLRLRRIAELLILRVLKFPYQNRMWRVVADKDILPEP
jgi:hypothetical protein